MMQPQTHLRLIASLLLLAGMLMVLVGLVFGLLMTGFACDAPGTNPWVCFAIGVPMGLVVAVVFAVPMFRAAYGLWQRRWRARRLALICSFFIVLFFPIGTAAGIYMIYKLWNLDRNDPLFDDVD